MFDPKALAWAFITWSIIIIAGDQAARSREQHYYPHCSPIAHEIQQSWHRGDISERDARQLIHNCLQAEDRGAFGY